MGKPRDGGASATWERDIKIIFCDLCLKEIELGNRPTTHFNKEGWLNLMKSFQEKTGREYDKIQLKNKWDQLKKDWKLWKELKRGSTGLGWDPKKKTIDASDEWWKEKLEVVPHARKFRYCGIDPELEDKLDLMFIGVVATGLHAWTPTQGLEYEEPQGDSDQLDYIGNPSEEQMQNMDIQTEPTHSKRQPSTFHTVERKRRHGAEFLRTKIDLLVAACTQNNSTSNASQPVIQPPQLSSAIKVLEEISEVFEDIPLYLFCTKLLEDPNKREVFMSMSPERRVYYLRYWFENHVV